MDEGEQVRGFFELAAQAARQASQVVDGDCFEAHAGTW
jgi:hypothetical protein